MRHLAYLRGPFFALVLGLGIGLFWATPTYAQSIDIDKIMNTPPTVTVGSQISFTIRITNTNGNGSAIASLPLTDTYDTTYISFDTAADLNGPNPASEAGDDGEILWNNVASLGTGGQLDDGEMIELTVWFTTKAGTTGITGTECATTGNTYNKASALGSDSCVAFPIDPPETKLLLGDVIWHDIDNDGIQDANEPGVDGVLVNLYEVTGSGNTLVISTTTMTTNTVSGFYQFDAVSGKNYMIQVAASNFVAGGPLEGFVVAANQPDITGTTVATQNAINTTANVDTLDFGFYCRFDLALDKKLTSATPIGPGDDVTFTISVYNQGTVTATGVMVADYIPLGFMLNDTDWTGGPTGTVTHTLAATLTPSGTVGYSTTVDIVLTAGAALSGTYTNTAEIVTYTSSIVDVNGSSLPDADSTPDDTDGNGTGGNAGESTDLEDDQINEDGTTPGQDEDDHDPAQIVVVPPAQFGDRVWLEEDSDGLASTGNPMPIVGLVITATNGTNTYTETTDALGYYSFTVPADTYTVSYGTVPASYGAVVPSTVVSGTAESGDAGMYEEPGNPDANHGQDTTVTLAPGEANWHVDFAFNLPEAQFGDRVWLEEDSDGLASTGNPMPIVGLVITATNGTNTYTETTDAMGYYSFTVPADTYTVTYGTVPASYGAVVPSTVVSGTTESGDAGTYKEAGDPDANHGQDTVVTVAAGEANWHVDFAFNLPIAQFGDRVWIESDSDGLAITGPITGVMGIVITATNGANVYTETTDALGYYSFTVPAGTYVVTYGPVPASYGLVVPSTVVSGTTESGNAGMYRETGDPDANHGQGTTVTLAAGEANWHVDFAFTVPTEPKLAVTKTLNGTGPFGVGVEISYTIRIVNTGNLTITVLPLEDRYNNVFITSPTASVTPDSDVPGVMVWNDLTVDLGDVGPGLTVSLVVTFTTAADTTLLTPVAPCTSSGHAPNIVEIENAMADPDGSGQMPAVQVIMDDDDDDCAEVQILNPTAVQLAERGMSATPDGVLVRWNTLSENNVVGFNILKSNGVASELRSSEMIVAQKAGQSSGANYEWLDAGASLNHGDTYILEVVNNDGTTERTVIAVMSGERIFLPFLAR